MFKWQKGRQNFYYEKLKIYSFWIIDCYLIRYSKGCAVPYHTDDIPNKKHYRLNIQLKGVNRLFELEKPLKKQRRVTFFRADKKHSWGCLLKMV